MLFQQISLVEFSIYTYSNYTRSHNGEIHLNVLPFCGTFPFQLS